MRTAVIRTSLATLAFGALLTATATAKPLSYKCSFPSQKLELTFVFEASDLQKPADRAFGLGTAVLVGSVGTSELLAIRGDNAISFIEPLATGAAQSTTISLSSGEAVHSRHSLLTVGDLQRYVQSQAKGNCLLLN